MNINSSFCSPLVCCIYPLLACLLLCLHPSCSSNLPLHKQHPSHRYRPLSDPTKDWSNKIGNSNFTYGSLAVMLSKKKSLSEKIREHIASIKQESSISPAVLLKMNILVIYQRELRAAENSLVTVLKDLNQTLSSDYGSIENIKKSCRMRQEDMRNAAVLVEEDYNIILDLEKELSSIHTNTSVQSHFKLVNEFLSEISHAADSLEKDLVEDIFSEYKNMQGVGLETVVKLSKDSLHEHNMKLLQDTGDKTSEEKDGPEDGRGGRGISMLIDSSSNQYILSRPRDVTFPVEDHHFIHDIINLLLLSFVLGGVCSLVTIPSLFGCMFAGMVLGPTGWNVVGSVVQVESLGEVGVIFIVFTVGLDFSFQKLQKVWRVALYGGNLLLALCILLAILLGAAFQVHPQQSLFMATCLSFSSNPLATRIVNRTSVSRRTRDSSSDSSNLEGSGSEVVDSVRGVLSMQDIQLGMLMALLPFFGAGKGHTHLFSMARFLQLLQILFGLPALVLVVRSLATRVIGRFYRQFSSVLTSPENVLFGSIALCLGTVLVAELMSGSLELGCFLAGVVISSHGTRETERVKKLTGPIRDLFSVFFFASLGFHVYPTFLRSEFSTMGTVMICIVALKFLLSMLVLGMFLGYNQRNTFILSVSLAQISEFSFVVASRARRMNIISREVYLVVLSVTTLSLLLSPLLWRVLLLNHPSSIVRGVAFHSPNLLTRTCNFFTSRFSHDCAA